MLAFKLLCSLVLVSLVALSVVKKFEEVAVDAVDDEVKVGQLCFSAQIFTTLQICLFAD